MRVVAKGLDRNGKELRIRASELLAQAVEHEIDHTNGILFLDHVASPDHLIRLRPGEHAAEAADPDEMHRLDQEEKDERDRKRRAS
jgi:hypothetical protein